MDTYGQATHETGLWWAGVERKLMKTVRKRLMAFPKHVHRKDDIERVALTGRVNDRKDRGRQGLNPLQSLKSVSSWRPTKILDFLRAEAKQDD